MAPVALADDLHLNEDKVHSLFVALTGSKTFDTVSYAILKHLET